MGKKKERIPKMKIGLSIAPEGAVKLEEIKLAYLKQGKRAKLGQIVEEALNDLWQKMYKK